MTIFSVAERRREKCGEGKSKMRKPREREKLGARGERERGGGQESPLA